MSQPNNPASSGSQSFSNPLSDRRSRTRASVRLRDQDGSSDQPSGLDQGAKSLSDALKITYFFLKIFMLAIVAAYLVSGFQTIGASERGIRLTFGKVVGSDLAPGLQPSWPEPVGELLKIDTGNQKLNLNKEFFVNLTESELSALNKTGTSSLAGGGLDALDPDADGMLLTGDGSIAHARVEVQYRRSDPVTFARTLDPEFEKKIVTSAVRRGIVQVVARVTLNEFIDDQMNSMLHDGDGRKISQAAQTRVQQILDSLQLGIQLTEFNILDRIPPRRVMSEFSRVQSASQDAQKQISEAREYRKGKLIETAGYAAEPILTLIDRYEEQFSRNDPAAAQTLADIDALLQGQPIKSPIGETINPAVTGDVTRLLDEARQYRNSIVSKAQSDLAVFNAKRAVYQADPRVMIASEWSQAFGTFMKRKTTQAMLLPPSSDRIVVQLNRDPKILQKIEKELYEAQYAKTEEERRIRMERDRFHEKINAETRTPAEQ